MINEVQNRLTISSHTRFFHLFYIPGIILTLHFFLKLFNSRCGVEEYLLIPPKSWVVCNSEQILEMFLFQKFSAILIPYGSSNSSTTSIVYVPIVVGMHFLCTTLVQMSKLYIVDFSKSFLIILNFVVWLYISKKCPNAHWSQHTNSWYWLHKTVSSIFGFCYL